MERNREADHACLVGQASARELNSELASVLSCASEVLGGIAPDDWVRPFLVDIQEAAQRCARRADGLLRYANNRGVRDLGQPSEALASIIP